MNNGRCKRLVLISFFADLLETTNGKLSEIVEGTVIDIQVYIALDAWQTASISVLPELPRTVELHFLDIVVGYPVGILVEDVVVEIARLKFIIGIDDGLHAVVVLHHIEPQLDALLELLVGLVLGFMLYVEHRGQVAMLEFDVADKELGLRLGVRVNAIEMVGTTCKTVFTSIVEIATEVLVNLTSSLSGLDHDETDGIAVDESLVFQLLPVDGALVVTNVDAMNLVALRVADVAIEGSPTEAERTYEDVVEEKDV